MEAPICSVHNKPMRHFEFGWKCTTLVGTGPDGKKIWCNQRVRNGQDTPRPTRSFAPTQAPSPEPTNAKIECAKASMAFAASLYRGTGDMVNAVMQAKKVYAEFLPLFEAKE